MIYMMDPSPMYAANVTAVITDFVSQTTDTQNGFSSPHIILLY